MARRIDLAQLLEASQDPSRTFSAALVDAIAALGNGARILVAISDLEGEAYRIKAHSGFVEPTGLPVEVRRTRAAEPTLAVGGHAVDTQPPNSLRQLFPLGDPVTTIFINLGPVKLEHYPLDQVLSPLLVIMIASESTSGLIREIEGVAPFLGRLYVGSLDELRLSIRSRLVSEATRSKDIGSVLRRTCKLAAEVFGLASAAVFVPDEVDPTLNLRALWPRPRHVEQFGNYPIRRQSDNDDVIWQSFTSGNMSIVAPRDLPGTSRSLVSPDWGQVLLVPLASGEAATPADTQGVMVCARRTSPIARRLSTFLWEDLFLLEFYSDILAILIQMLRARDEAAYHVERVLHGAKTLLSTIRSNLSLLDEHHFSSAVRPELQYFLPDSIALLDDLSSQIDRQRLSSLDRIEGIAEVKLFGDVLAKLTSFAPALAQALGRNPMRVNNLKDDGFDRLPSVHSNRDALVTVFRNLAHNAVKYSNRDEGQKTWFHLKAEKESEGVAVFVSDDGIGIPAEARTRVFEEGYRADNAVAIDPTGVGIGLHDCRQIMEMLGGTIQVVDCIETSFGPASTTIKVWIPRTPELGVDPT
jgi:signal transduction histidine kinase